MSISTPLHLQSLASLTQLLQHKKISSVELTQHFLDRIQRYDPILNSFITVCPEFALQQAAAADQRLAQQQHTALTGIPIAQKDNFCTLGIKTTAASKMLANFIPPYESTVTARCHAAGMVMLGKTNMDEFAMGSTTENSAFGPTKNPWDINRIPGGSSGGSSAALAAALCPLATGSDTGGSIRQPAALCNLTGIKPTYGRISRWGMIAYASSFDQAGPMARSAEDCAYLLQVLAGMDPLDSTSAEVPVPDYVSALSQSLQGKTIGLPTEYFELLPNHEIAHALEQTKTTLAKLGVNFKSISLPYTHLATAAYYILAPAEASLNLARYDGVRFGYRCAQPRDLNDLYQRSRDEGFGSEVKRRILMGTYVLSSGYYDAYYRQAQRVRRLIQNDFLAAFQEVDLILTPTTPGIALPFDRKSHDDPAAILHQDIFTTPVNLAGLPALSMPIGRKQGLPIGGQLIGPHFSEDILLAVSHAYQQDSEWHTMWPEDYLA